MRKRRAAAVKPPASATFLNINRLLRSIFQTGLLFCFYEQYVIILAYCSFYGNDDNSYVGDGTIVSKL